MIIFKGNPSGKCKQYIKRCKRRFMLVVSGIAAAFVTFSMILPCAILVSPYAWMFMVLPVYFVFHLSFFDSTLNIMPSEIVIETIKDGNMSAFYEHNTGRKELVVLISDIEVVFDAGGYYYFKANSSATAYRQMYWFSCQKDLLIKGTIGDFEKIFEGKIVKEHIKDN